MYFHECQKSLTQSCLFEVSSKLLNIQWSKQPPCIEIALWSLHFFTVFLLFFRKTSFCLCKSIYFWISTPNFPMEAEEGGVLHKTSDRKSLFFLKIKNRQDPDCPSKEYNVIFKYKSWEILAFGRAMNIYINYLMFPQADKM